MSPNNPGNFVNDLVEMAKAFEALPKVQADLEQVRQDNDDYLSTIQRLELKLVDRANEIASLQSTIRSLEVERDDAQFHALEADDRTSRALDFIKATFGNAGSLIQALEPPAPVVPQPDPLSELLYSSTTSSKPEAVTGSPEPSASPSPASEVAPTHPTPDANSPNASLVNAPIGSAETADTVASSTSVDPASSRYSGKTYSDAKRDAGDAWQWPNQEEWFASGGTIDNFFA